jgi:hypothetical protein
VSASTGTTPGPLFGRKWQLDVTSPSGGQVLSIKSTDLDQPLRMTFEVHTQWYQWFWWADIRIYNLNSQTSNWVLSQGNTAGNSTATPAASTAGPIQQGMKVVLQAGYQDPSMYGIIFEGTVLQPLFDRLNSTDFVITLHCVVGLNEDTRNFVNQVYDKGVDPLTMVKKMAAACYHPISVGTLAPRLSGKPLSRAKVVFGNPGKHFSEIADSTNLQWWLDGRGFTTGTSATLQFGDLVKQFPSSPKYTFQAANTTPSASGNICSIIGTPTQTQYGVNCRLLLNPNVIITNPVMAIKIDNTVIQQLQRQIGDISTIGILSPTGTYAVIGARYIGDTRGTDWYTDVTGFLGQGYLAALAEFGGYINQ